VRKPSLGLAGRDYVRSVTVAGIRHDYHVYVPSSYDGASRIPLMLSLHGGGGNAGQWEGTVNHRPTAEKHGFILVRPEGYDRSGLGVRTWNAGSCCGAAVADRVDHVAAVRAILDRVEEEWRVDPERIYATGHSNGGMMSYRLACELGDRIAAVAPNSAALLDRDLDAEPPATLFACSPPRGVPLMHMHGDADTCSPMAGGVSTGFETATRPPVAYGIARFVAINQASNTPRVSYQRGEVTCVTYDGAADADVVFCVAKGGGHAWPGAGYSFRTRINCGGTAITGMDANEEIWKFFSAHPRTP
jgi:polyhydroxybutyrate depolymerase